MENAIFQFLIFTITNRSTGSINALSGAAERMEDVYRALLSISDHSAGDYAAGLYLANVALASS
jgi:hypothetical protein